MPDGVRMSQKALVILGVKSFHCFWQLRYGSLWQELCLRNGTWLGSELAGDVVEVLSTDNSRKNMADKGDS